MKKKLTPKEIWLTLWNLGFEMPFEAFLVRNVSFKINTDKSALSESIGRV